MTCMQELIVREFSFHQLNANLLWPGTFSFAEWLVQHRSWMDGGRVLELGRYGLWDWTMWFFCISNIMVASHQLVGIFFHAFFLLLLLSAFMSIFLFLKILCKILCLVEFDFRKFSAKHICFFFYWSEHRKF